MSKTTMNPYEEVGQTSKNPRLLLHAGWYMGTDGTLREDHGLIIEGENVIATGSWDELVHHHERSYTLELVDCLVTPGWQVGLSRIEWWLLRDHGKGLWFPWEEEKLPDIWGKLTRKDKVIGAMAGVLEMIRHGITRVHDLSIMPEVRKLLTTSGLDAHFIDKEWLRVEKLESLTVGTSGYEPEAIRVSVLIEDPQRGYAHRVFFHPAVVAMMIKDEAPSFSWSFGVPVTPWDSDLPGRLKMLTWSLLGSEKKDLDPFILVNGLWGPASLKTDVTPFPADLTAIQVQDIPSMPQPSPLRRLIFHSRSRDVFMTMVKGDILYLNRRFMGVAGDIAENLLHGWNELSSEARALYMSRADHLVRE